VRQPLRQPPLLLGRPALRDHGRACARQPHERLREALASGVPLLSTPMRP
jgi:hypothetical protein